MSFAPAPMPITPVHIFSPRIRTTYILFVYIADILVLDTQTGRQQEEVLLLVQRSLVANLECTAALYQKTHEQGEALADIMGKVASGTGLIAERVGGLLSAPPPMWVPPDVREVIEGRMDPTMGPTDRIQDIDLADSIHYLSPTHQMWIKSGDGMTTKSNVAATNWRKWLASVLRQAYPNVWMPTFNIYAKWPTWAFQWLQAALPPAMYETFCSDNCSRSIAGCHMYEPFVGEQNFNPYDPRWDYPPVCPQYA